MLTDGGIPTFSLTADLLNDARIYVGSCRDFMDVTSNHECSPGIGSDVSDVAGGNGYDNVIATNCPAGNYGRYVYILPADGTAGLGLCEVMVFGDDGNLSY